VAAASFQRLKWLASMQRRLGVADETANGKRPRRANSCTVRSLTPNRDASSSLKITALSFISTPPGKNPFLFVGRQQGFGALEGHVLSHLHFRSPSRGYGPAPASLFSSGSGEVRQQYRRDQPTAVNFHYPYRIILSSKM